MKKKREKREKLNKILIYIKYFYFVKRTIILNPECSLSRARLSSIRLELEYPFTLSSSSSSSSFEARLSSILFITSRARVLRYSARLGSARLVYIPSLDYFETFSPVIKAATIRVMLSLAVHNQWDIQQIDINNAFLNGELTETVYMYQPEGFADPKLPKHVCKLHKALYGLKQAPRAWFDKSKGVLLSWGFENSTSDVSLFYYKREAQVIYLLVYVDDILLTGNDNHLIKQIVTDLNRKFALKTLGSLSYFLGFEVTRNNRSLLLTQTKYARELLHKAGMADSKLC